MNLTLHIPDKIVEHLGLPASDLEREALEFLVLEKYRAGRLSKDELAEMLNFDGGDQIDGFLKAHDVYYEYSMADLERDRKTLDELGLDKPKQVNLAEAIRQRFAPVGGVDDLVIPPREAL